MSEREFVAWLRDRFRPSPDAGVLVGAGPDDCAIVDISGLSALAITTDTIVENTHFSPDASPHEIGRKAVAVNLSDLAASGCRPRWGVVAASLRRGCGVEWAKGVAEGISAIAEAHGLSIVGGDTTSTDGPSTLTLSLLGTPYRDPPLLRSGGRPGDVLVVTGSLGGSILSRHLSFAPRLREIEAILDICRPTACMDITDGLAMDLGRLARESGCGAILNASSIPISEDAGHLAKTSGRSAIDHALTDGEDFELLLALSPPDWEHLQAAWPSTLLDTPLSRIGRLTEDAGLHLQEEGHTKPLEEGGYDHAF